MTNTNQYDLAIIGAGAGGLSVAAAAAQLGVKVVLIEKGEMGGDCLNDGCVPSKALLAASKVAYTFKSSDKFGVKSQQPIVEMAKVMQHVQGVIDAIAPHDSVERFTKMGVTVIKATARFVGKKTVMAGESQISAKHFVIATGSSPAVPPIPGLDQVPYFTNETIFGLSEKPEHLVIIGGGPIGCELAQAFLLLGVTVTVLEAATILPRDEQELVEILRGRLVRQGLCLHEKTKVVRVELVAGNIRILIEKDGVQKNIIGSHLLVAAGRRVNVGGLDLEKAGIDYTPKGIQVNKQLRTTNKRVYCIGDVAGSYQFTHVANYHAGIVIRNILFKLPAKISGNAIPWVTYTDIELAHAGMLAEDAVKQYTGTKILSMDLSEVDRAQTEQKLEGKIKIAVTKKGRVLGVSILAPNAGELLLPWLMLIREKKSLRSLTDVIVPYPTYSELSKRVAGEFYAPRLFSPLVKWVVKVLGWF